jgi:glycine/D-amino acid oxidase-like deaminating enzyme
MQISFWEKDTFFDKTDIIIIGSGIVGLNAAIHLKEKNPNLKIIIVERGALPCGASTKNAGFACFGSLSELLDDTELNGEDAMLSLVEKRWQGLLNLREKLGDKTLDYSPLCGHEVFTDIDKDVFENCISNLDKYNLLLKDIVGKNVFESDDKKLSSNELSGFTHLIRNNYEGQLHTGRMMEKLFRLAQNLDITIMNGLDITRIDEGNNYVKIYTDKGWTLKSKKILVCTNGFTKRLFPSLEVKPARNQVLITAPLPGLKLEGSFHHHKGYVYFRNVGNRVLLGGGRHLYLHEESTDKMELTDEIQNFLEQFLFNHILRNFSNTAIEMRWSGILGIGEKKNPIITQYSDHIFTAVRLGGMGVAIGILVGKEAADLLLKSL